MAVTALLEAYNSTLDGDEWGNTQAWRFATAHVLWHLGECPDEWQYRHGFCFVEDVEFEDYEEQELSWMLDAGEVAVHDLIYFGEILNNNRDTLVGEGKDY